MPWGNWNFGGGYYNQQAAENSAGSWRAFGRNQARHDDSLRRELDAKQKRYEHNSRLREMKWKAEEEEYAEKLNQRKERRNATKGNSPAPENNSGINVVPADTNTYVSTKQALDTEKELLETPTNEASILPALGEAAQRRYHELKTAMQQAVAKHPNTDSSIYTEYLTDYLNTAKTFDTNTKDADGKHLSPRIIKEQLDNIDQAVMKQFDQKYPVDTASKDPETVERVKHNRLALQRLRTEVEGEGWVGGIVRSVYDENRNGVQWGNIIGGGAGAMVGYLMGSTIAGAGEVGGSWMGMIATTLLTVAGAMFGAQIAGMVSNNSAPAHNNGQKRTPDTPGKTREPERSTPEHTTDKSNTLTSAIKEQAKAAVTNTISIAAADHNNSVTPQSLPAHVAAEKTKATQQINT
jgi:hypothetical protein